MRATATHHICYGYQDYSDHWVFHSSNVVLLRGQTGCSVTDSHD